MLQQKCSREDSLCPRDTGICIQKENSTGYSEAMAIAYSSLLVSSGHKIKDQQPRIWKVSLISKRDKCEEIFLCLQKGVVYAERILNADTAKQWGGADNLFAKYFSRKKHIISVKRIVSWRHKTITKEEGMLTNIVISQLPQRQTYYTGDTELDLTGGQICLIGEGGQYEQVLMTDSDIHYEWSSEKAGAALVTLSCQGKTAQFQVIVKDPVLKRMSVISPPQKRVYVEGEMLDFTGLRLMGEYEGGLKREITKIPDIEHQVTKEDRVYTLSIGSASIPIYFKVEAAKIVSIRMEAFPTKIEYLERAEGFDVTGGTIVQTFENGNRETVPLKPEWVSGFSNAVPGVITLTVQVGEAKTNFDIVIAAKKPATLTVTKMPAKVDYFEGEALDLTGLEIQITYNNGDVAIADKWICKTNAARTADPKVLISACDLEVSFPISVVQPQLVGIRLQALPEKTQYAKGKEQLDLTGLVLVADYDNGVSGLISVSPEMVSGFDNSAAGECKICIHYGVYTAEFAVEITDGDLLGLLISHMPFKTVYVAGEMFDPDGLEVSGFYSDGLLKQVETYSIVPDRALGTGDIAVVVEAEGKTTVIPIFVQ